jgi:hypothetical protein
MAKTGKKMYAVKDGKKIGELSISNWQLSDYQQGLENCQL